MYVSVGFYPGTAEPGEVFVTIAKSGSTVAGFVNAWATTVSIAWQYGVPWPMLREKYLHHKFDPSDARCPSLLHAVAVAVDELLETARRSVEVSGRPTPVGVLPTPGQAVEAGPPPELEHPAPPPAAEHNHE